MRAVLILAGGALVALGFLVTVMVLSFAIELLATTLQAPEPCATDLECELRCGPPEDEVQV